MHFFRLSRVERKFRQVSRLPGHKNWTYYGDKGYISQSLTEELAAQGVTLITGKRKNMKAKVISVWNKIMLSKRFIIETINAIYFTLFFMGAVETGLKN
jgi:hypothetical protein